MKCKGIVTNLISIPFSYDYERNATTRPVRTWYNLVGNEERNHFNPMPGDKVPDIWREFVTQERDNLYEMRDDFKFYFDNLGTFAPSFDHFTIDHTRTNSTGILPWKNSTQTEHGHRVHAHIQETVEILHNGSLRVFFGTGDALTVHDWQPGTTDGHHDMDVVVDNFNPAVNVEGHGDVLEIVMRVNDEPSLKQMILTKLEGLLAAGAVAAITAAGEALTIESGGLGQSAVFSLVEWVVNEANKAGVGIAKKAAKEALDGLFTPGRTTNASPIFDKVTSLTDQIKTIGWKKHYVVANGQELDASFNALTTDPSTRYDGEWKINRYGVSQMATVLPVDQRTWRVETSIDIVRSGKTTSKYQNGDDIDTNVTIPLPINAADVNSANTRMWIEYEIGGDQVGDGAVTHYRPIAWKAPGPGVWTVLTQWGGGTWT
jgi:hypothetical protein